MFHKTNKLTGLHLFATDGKIGHVDDFLVDEDWRIRYLVVDTSNWIGGKAVIVPSEAVEEIDSPRQEIRLSWNRDQVKNAPSVDTADIEPIETLPPPIL